MGSTAHIGEGKGELAKYVHRLAHLGVRLIDFVEWGIEVTSGAELSLVSEVEGEKDSNHVHKQWWLLNKGEMVFWGIKVDCGIDSKDNWDDYLSYMESLTTIVTILAPIWLVMKLFMGEDVDLLLKWFEVSKARLIGPELVHRAI